VNLQNIHQQEILERISQHCPEAMAVYIQCFNRSDKDGNIFFSKQKVDVDMSENWRSFRNNIKKLARESLLEWHPLDDGIAVTLADIYDDE
jgi:hypothetical protein